MKYDNVLSEAASVVCSHGFAEAEFGSVETLEGWNALAVVTSTVLLNLDADEDLISRLVSEFPEARSGGFLVWINEDSNGFVSLMEFGSDAGLRSGSDMVSRAFDEAEARSN